MRVPAGKVLRVGPGDEVVVRARLPNKSRLGRLYVFARYASGGDFSPYVQDPASDVITAQPRMVSPMSMRLIESHPAREISFTADFDGFVRVMQEVDGPKDPVARVKINRTISPDLGWKARIYRKLLGVTGYFQ